MTHAVPFSGYSPSSDPNDRFETFAPPPSSLSATRFQMDGDDYAVFSFRTSAANLPEALSPCEREVLLAAVRGDSNREIAQARGKSERTVANQVQAIFRKLDVHSRGELAVWYTRRRIPL